MSTPGKMLLSLEKQCQAFKMLNMPLNVRLPMRELQS